MDKFFYGIDLEPHSREIEVIYKKKRKYILHPNSIVLKYLYSALMVCMLYNMMVQPFVDGFIEFYFEGEEIITASVCWENKMSMWRVDIGLSLNNIVPEDLFVEETVYEVIGNIYEHPDLLDERTT